MRLNKAFTMIIMTRLQSFELLSRKHVSASDRRVIISLSQIFAGQVGAISVATVTSQVEHAPHG